MVLNKIFYLGFWAGVVGGGAGSLSRHRKVHGLSKISSTYAANFAIVTGCYCGNLFSVLYLFSVSDLWNFLF